VKINGDLLSQILISAVNALK